MAAYVVVNVDVRDPVRYEEYKRLVQAAIAAYGGRHLVRGGALEVLEGNWQPPRPVILEFPTVEQARAWWRSPEYAGAKELRHSCANTQLVLIAGVAT